MDILNNFRYAYTVLCHNVRVALRVQVGDQERLDMQCQDVLRFLASAEHHIHIFPAAEYSNLISSTATMIQALDDAKHISTDPPETAPLIVASRVQTGRRGQPRVEIDKDFLSTALTLRGPAGLSSITQCSSRTIRRRTLEYGLAQPAAPVYRDDTDASGAVIRIHTPHTRSMSAISDHELDTKIATALLLFPNFGRRMLAGYLRSQGHQVPREHIIASYLRVHGPPRLFGDRRIVRRKYHVAGVNSLWHHDGQHGLIRYKLITHAFIDGKSRLVTGIAVHNNNQSATVLSLFLAAIQQYGAPSRVRGDHGTENVGVASWMEENRGSGRGSYIWGRSVHNTRIERLWYDITRGYGTKWKNLFMDLETHYGLDPQNPAHIWLLHHLFLSAINQDAQDWAAAWNNHTLQLEGERDRSPHDIFFFGLVEGGARGLQFISSPADEVLEPEDIAGYGVDWEIHDHPRIMEHLLVNNLQDWQADEDNPFIPPTHPTKLSHVECEPPDAPLTDEGIALLQDTLRQHIPMASRSVEACKLMWSEALAFCIGL